MSLTSEKKDTTTSSLFVDNFVDVAFLSFFYFRPEHRILQFIVHLRVFPGSCETIEGVQLRM